MCRQLSFLVPAIFSTFLGFFAFVLDVDSRWFIISYSLVAYVVSFGVLLATAGCRHTVVVLQLHFVVNVHS